MGVDVPLIDKPSGGAAQNAQLLPSITGQTFEALAETVRGLGQPPFRAKQLFSWLHQGGCESFEAMTNLPLPLRQKLAASFRIEAPRVVRRQASAQDGTVKLLLELCDGSRVETVLMRYKHGHSVCVSSQVGCRMGCAFCASAKGGLVRGLSAGEMVAQVNAAAKEAGGRVGHLVLMGIGEPLDNFDNVMNFLAILTHPQGRNFSARNISLSTCGLVPQIERLAQRDLPLTLSVSLHAATDEVRDELMPVNRKWPVAQLAAACRAYRRATGRRVSYEYILLAGVNDTDEACDSLAGLLKGTDSHVNLIPANAVEGTGFAASSQMRTEGFRARLEKAGVRATVRRRLGADIDAACGQLRMRAADSEGGQR